MSWPTSQDYNEAIQSPASSFADVDLKTGEAAVNAIGLPIPRSGSFADVYEYHSADGRRWAVKCFTRKVAGLEERYARIDEHLTRANLPFTVGFKFLEKGVRVRGEWYPILKMEWVEGLTLNEFVRDNANKPQYLHALTQMWAKLSRRLRRAQVAHADLQHGNVLLVPGATPTKLQLRLIDYDGMWVPALAEQHSGEVGHPNYQHPLRLRDKLFDRDVDRFPHLVIAAALRATLLGGKALWDRFDNGDNLLFKEVDLRDPGKAAVFKELWKLNDDALCALLGQLTLSERQPLAKTPWLDKVLLEAPGPTLSPADETTVCARLGVRPRFDGRAAASMTDSIASAFNDFAFDDDDEPAGSSTRERPVIDYRAKTKKNTMLPWMIGGGGAAVAIIVAGIVLLNRGKPTPAPTTTPEEVVVRKTDKEKEKEPPPTTKPEPPKEKKKTKKKDDEPPKEVLVGPETLTLLPRVVDEPPIVVTGPEELAILPREVRIEKPPDPVVVKKDPDLPEGMLRAGEPLPEPIFQTLYSTDGKKLFLIDKSATLHVFDAASLKPLGKAALGSGPLQSVFVRRMPTGADRLFILDDDRELSTFDPDRMTAKTQTLREMSKDLAATNSANRYRLAISPDGAYAIVADRDGAKQMLFALRVGVDPYPSYWPFKTDQHVRNVGFTPDGRYGFAALSDEVGIWERKMAAFFQPVNTLPLPGPMDWMALCVEAGAIVASDRSKVYAWNMLKETRLWEPIEPHGPNNTVGVALVPRVAQAVTAGLDKTVKLWDLRTGKELGKWTLEEPPVGLAISPDGKAIAVSLKSNKVTLWRPPATKK
jgi:DNA-binding beta-propeller fold protein YncE